LIGHSDSGLFALHTLFQAPETFNAYVAISPAVWGDDGQFVETLKRTLAENRAFKNSLFTSLASEGGDQRETYDSFVGMIREANIEGLEFSNAYFLEEDHGSTIMPAMREGLLTVYTDWGPPDSVSRLEQLLSHYRNLSKRYGYAIPVPVRHASNAGFNLIRNGDPAAALEIFEYSLSNISQDAIGHYQVAVALQRLGRLSEALSQYEQAIELGSGTDMYPVFVSRRDEVAQEIREQEVSE
jgi:tetratricopeptide (TPR) repeat protein